MTELEAIYQSILEDPKNDVIRYAYVDCLLENNREVEARYIKNALCSPNTRTSLTMSCPNYGILSVTYNRGFLCEIVLNLHAFIGPVMCPCYCFPNIQGYDCEKCKPQKLELAKCLFQKFPIERVHVSTDTRHSLRNEQLLYGINHILIPVLQERFFRSPEEQRDYVNESALQYGLKLAEINRRS